MRRVGRLLGRVLLVLALLVGGIWVFAPREPVTPGRFDAGQLQQDLENFAKDLEKEHGPAIKAGYNVSRRADQAASGQTDLRQRLRDFYRDAIFSERNPAEAYTFIMDQFPREAVPNPAP